MALLICPDLESSTDGMTRSEVECVSEASIEKSLIRGGKHFIRCSKWIYEEVFLRDSAGEINSFKRNLVFIIYEGERL